MLGLGEVHGGTPDCLLVSGLVLGQAGTFLGPVLISLPPVRDVLEITEWEFVCVSLPTHGLIPQEAQLLPCEASGQSVAITIFCSLVLSNGIVFILCVSVCADSFKNFPGRIRKG